MAAFPAMHASRWPSSFTNSPSPFLTRDSVGNNHIDWAVTSEAYNFSASLPDARKEEIRVRIEDSKYVCIETESVGVRSARAGFWRKFRLPGGVDVAGISAEFRDGVLSITVPRLVPVAPPSAPARSFTVDPQDVPSIVTAAVARAA